MTPEKASDPVYLAALSPRDARFDQKRRECSQLKDLYYGTKYHDYSLRMSRCSPRLDFAFRIGENGLLAPKLQAANFCRCRGCSVCGWRRSVMWQAKALQIIPKVVEAYPKSRFIFLTLTVRNCELPNLRQTLAWMHQAWTKLVKRKEFAAVQGWIRSVEITRSLDDTAHPHYHALLMVKPGYFSTGYVSQKKWTEAWQSCLNVEYTPIVDVRSVRAGRREKGDEGGVLMLSAICETLKYSVKPAECLNSFKGQRISNQDWLVGLTDQLHKTRAIATGGILKKYLKELEREPADLIHADENGLIEPDSESPRIAFDWKEEIKRYVLEEVS